MLTMSMSGETVNIKIGLLASCSITSCLFMNDFHIC